VLGGTALPQVLSIIPLGLAIAMRVVQMVNRSQDGILPLCLMALSVDLPWTLLIGAVKSPWRGQRQVVLGDASQAVQERRK
jgi:hypothetical protein